MNDLDFGTLAQIARPQMMPSAPIGAGALAGAVYGQDRARQDAYLDQAANIANINAKMQEMKANEFAAGAPGRMSQIALGNQEAADTLGAYNQDGVGKDTIFAKARMGLSDAHAAELDKAANLLRPLATADDPNQLQQAYDEVSKYMPQIKQITPQQAQDKAKALLQSQVMNPKQIGSERTAGIVGGYRVGAAAATAQGRVEAANIYADARVKVAKMLDEAKKAGQPIDEKRAVEMMYSGDPRQIAEYWYQKAQVTGLAAKGASAETANSLLNPGAGGGGVNVSSPKPLSPPAPKTAPAPTTKQEGLDENGNPTPPKGSPMSWEQAIKFLREHKNDPHYDTYYNYFVNTWGPKAAVKLPADLKKN